MPNALVLPKALADCVCVLPPNGVGAGAPYADFDWSLSPDLFELAAQTGFASCFCWATAPNALVPAFAKLANPPPPPNALVDAGFGVVEAGVDVCPKADCPKAG